MLGKKADSFEAADLLIDSSALLSFHTTSYSKYLQHLASNLRSAWQLLTRELPNKATPVLESNHKLCRAVEPRT